MDMREDIVLKKTTVLDQIEIAPEVFVLSINKQKATFKAGQVVAVSLNIDVPPRIYSIASGENENYIDVLYDVVKEGALTPELKKLKKGDSVFVSQPYGSFTGDHSKALWIATGTGIAPFVSMIKSGYGQHKTLVHGARQDKYFFYADLFLSKLGNRYIRCCSQCTENTGYAGRLTRYLSEQPSLPLDQNYYLCGAAEMVVDVRDLLIAKGIPYQQIISEIYF